jgi:hypothetical protein
MVTAFVKYSLDWLKTSTLKVNPVKSAIRRHIKEQSQAFKELQFMNAYTALVKKTRPITLQ